MDEASGAGQICWCLCFVGGNLLPLPEKQCFPQGRVKASTCVVVTFVHSTDLLGVSVY